MAQDENAFEIVDDTQVMIGEGSITEEELKQLQNLNIVVSYKTNNYQLTQIEFNTRQLRDIGFEYNILKDVASSIEVEVMRVFRRTDTERLTTGEISDSIDKPPSSVSRALARLVDKGQIEKIQRGVYSSV